MSSGRVAPALVLLGAGLVLSCSWFGKVKEAPPTPYALMAATAAGHGEMFACG